MELILTFDDTVIHFINDNMRNGLLNKIMEFVSLLGNGGILWVGFAFAFILMGGEKRKIGLLMIASMMVEASVCNIVIKPAVGRIRPFDVHDMEIIINKPLDYSFPSGHTAAAYAAAYSLYLSDKKKGGKMLYAAALMGFSRIYLLVHYPTDVVCGALLGILSALSVNKLYLTNKSKKTSNRS
ncbi:MAG: phosphatase PAP2 family protein [Candidatus Metalachnospira sp.]|nr:phosphatase PAP2 family protein [Candidatus Metalachnospira sp.]